MSLFNKFNVSTTATFDRQFLRILYFPVLVIYWFYVHLANFAGFWRFGKNEKILDGGS